MKIKPLDGIVIFKSKSAFRETMKYKSLILSEPIHKNVVDSFDGQSMVDSEYRNAINSAEVVAIPEKNSSTKIIGQITRGNAHVGHEEIVKHNKYASRDMYFPSTFVPEYEYQDSLSMDVNIGDEILFPFDAIFDDNIVSVEDGEIYYRIEYHNILGYVRGGLMHSCGKFVICEPIKERRLEIVNGEPGYRLHTIKGVGKVLHIHDKYSFVTNKDETVMFLPHNVIDFQYEGMEYIAVNLDYVKIVQNRM